MSIYAKVQTGRAAAVLTLLEVAGNRFNLDQAHDGSLTVDLSFTLGNLTSCTVKFYASMDGTTYDLINAGGTDLTQSLTASTERCYVMPNLSGWKFFRVSLQGVGDVTNSTANYTYRWLRKGSQ